MLLLLFVSYTFITCAFVFLTSGYPCYDDATILLLLLSSNSWANMFTLSSNTSTNATIEWCNNVVLLILYVVISCCYFCILWYVVIPSVSYTFITCPFVFLTSGITCTFVFWLLIWFQFVYCTNWYDLKMLLLPYLRLLLLVFDFWYIYKLVCCKTNLTYKWKRNRNGSGYL